MTKTPNSFTLITPSINGIFIISKNLIYIDFVKLRVRVRVKVKSKN